MLHETSNTLDEGQAAANAPRGRWLLLIYHLPTEPSSARTAIWRETRKLGTLSLQHGVGLLPLTEQNQASYARLARRIEEYGGEATILETSSPDRAWHERIVGRLNAARNEEYEELVEETERFHEEVARERRKEKYNFAELEDLEGNLERLRKFLAQIHVRDAFGASGHGPAVEAIERCAQALEAFAHDVYARQEGGTA